MIFLFLVPFFTLIIVFVIGIVLYNYDQKISRTNFVMLDLQEKMGIGRINLLLNSIQLTKMAATQGSQLVLSNLKSDDAKFLADQLKEEMINLYNAMKKGKIDREILKNMTFEELNRQFYLINDSFLKEANEVVKLRNEKGKELKRQIKNRNFAYSIIIIMQIIISTLSLLVNLK